VLAFARVCVSVSVVNVSVTTGEALEMHLWLKLFSSIHSFFLSVLPGTNQAQPVHELEMKKREVQF
jgi:hypothetical protein